MAADGEIKIDTKLDTDGLNEGLKDLKVKLNNLGVETEKSTKKEKEFNKELDKTADKAEDAGKAVEKATKKNKNLGDILKTVKTSINGATIAGVAAAAAVKKTVEVLNECAAAYRVQANAEESLQIAAKNNPYLNSESVYNLKNFAGELQNLSEIGDEVSLQVMSQLAATGRNEEQIMQIMSAAADMAAVTGQDLASAAQQLNATLNGNAGALGRQIGAINNLTKEELENGKAIELVAKQYAGAAKATADIEAQLSNAWGDFKENIGRGWQNVTQPVKQFFVDILNDINTATAKTNALRTAGNNRNNGTASAGDTKLLLDDAKAQVEATQKQIQDTINLLNNEEELNKKVQESRGYVSKATFQRFLSDLQKRYESEIETVNQLTAEYNALSDAEKAAADAAAAQASAVEKAAARQKRNDEASEHIKNNTKAMNEQVKALELKAKLTGQEVDTGELYNVYLQSYIDLITKSNGLVTENNQAAKDRLKIVEEYAKKAKDAATAEERLAAAQALLKKAQEGDDTYKKKQEELKKLREDITNDLIKFDNDEVKNAEKKKQALEELDKEYAQNKKDLWHDITEEINKYSEQTANVAKEFGDLMLENVQTETDLELQKLEEKYEKGEVSEEEYYEKQKAIKRKAAQEEYKIKMFEWSASVLAATANIAEGVSKAIAQGGTAGLLTGALVGAAGAVQIASIIASKPIPPQFAAGGIIGGANGATMGSDNTLINARYGEMVLNAHQQRNLWDKLNGQDNRQQAGYDVTVNNTQAGRVDTDVRQTNDGLFIDILDKHINKGFNDGTYDAGVASMNTRQEGVRIL